MVGAAFYEDVVGQLGQHRQHAARDRDELDDAHGAQRGTHAARGGQVLARVHRDPFGLERAEDRHGIAQCRKAGKSNRGHREPRQ
jgi:hypothetical protein